MLEILFNNVLTMFSYKLKDIVIIIIVRPLSFVCERILSKVCLSK